MENKLENLKEKMDKTVLKDVYFDDKHARHVLNTIKKSEFKKREFPLKNKFNALLSVSVVSILFLGIIYFVGIQLNLLDGPERRPAGEPKETLPLKEEAASIEENKEAIKKILELEFTGPDEKLMDLMWNPKYKTVVNGQEENKEFDQYIEEKYGPYFTESGLQSFIAAFGGTQYHTFAYNSEYQLSFKDAMIEQNENNPRLFTFIAKVGYQKNGEEEKTVNVEGKVLISTEEKGKIGEFQYGNDEGLSDKLRE
ncbi:hypothetical protein [Mesobacillus subterraneus]|uniref:Uncharacterized protein n=1 Tax=Mesobacillus subterraneus TaxID=285983 RepID=A0A427TX68_9BACI|nr:hypothetical protein [Mesobacillus subterraneus]RSD28994.1 hypothetical protein EJA10_02470 [Mesobacillus subterraneus]